MKTAVQLRAEAQKLMDQAAALDAAAAEFQKLHRVRVVCGPCLGRGYFTKGNPHHGYDQRDCEACGGRGYHLMLAHRGALPDKWPSEMVLPVTTGWEL